MFGGIEHLIDGARFGEADDARGQTFHHIGVVGRLDGEHVAGDAADGEIAFGEAHRRVGLQPHPAVEAVEVEAGDGAALVGAVRLFLDDRCQSGDFKGREAECAGLGAALFSPESGVIVTYLGY